MSIDLLKDSNLDESQSQLLQQAELCVGMLQQSVGKAVDVMDSISEIKICEMNIQQLIRNSEATIVAYSKQVPVSFEVTDSCPQTIHTDVRIVQQCLVNIVSNACKFTPSGHITCRLSGVTMKPKTAPPRKVAATRPAIRIEVVDTGVGVPEDLADFLFKPFVQAYHGRYSETILKLSEGTGLGLYVTRLSTEAIGGSCGFQNNPSGQGSVFWLQFPDMDAGDVIGGNSMCISPQDVINPEPLPEELEVQRPVSMSIISLPTVPLRGLVVDDSVTMRKLLVKVLQKNGFEAIEASNGLEGLEIMTGVSREFLEFDIIFMDFLMPVMDGIECVRRYREWLAGPDAQGTKAPIWGISANAQVDDISVGIGLGMDGFLSKPIDMPTLKNLLKGISAAKEALSTIREGNIDGPSTSPPEIDPVQSSEATVNKNGRRFFTGNFAAGKCFPFFKRSHRESRNKSKATGDP